MFLGHSKRRLILGLALAAIGVLLARSAAEAQLNPSSRQKPTGRPAQFAQMQQPQALPNAGAAANALGIRPGRPNPHNMPPFAVKGPTSPAGHRPPPPNKDFKQTPDSQLPKAARAPIGNGATILPGPHKVSPGKTSTLPPAGKEKKLQKDSKTPVGKLPVGAHISDRPAGVSKVPPRSGSGLAKKPDMLNPLKSPVQPAPQFSFAEPTEGETSPDPGTPLDLSRDPDTRSSDERNGTIIATPPGESVDDDDNDWSVDLLVQATLESAAEFAEATGHPEIAIALKAISFVLNANTAANQMKDHRPPSLVPLPPSRDPIYYDPDPSQQNGPTGPPRRPRNLGDPLPPGGEIGGGGQPPMGNPGDPLPPGGDPGGGGQPPMRNPGDPLPPGLDGSFGGGGGGGPGVDGIPGRNPGVNGSGDGLGGIDTPEGGHEGGGISIEAIPADAVTSGSFPAAKTRNDAAAVKGNRKMPIRRPVPQTTPANRPVTPAPPVQGKPGTAGLRGAGQTMASPSPSRPVGAPR